MCWVQTRCYHGSGHLTVGSGDLNGTGFRVSGRRGLEENGEGVKNGMWGVLEFKGKQGAPQLGCGLVLAEGKEGKVLCNPRANSF